MPSPKKNNLTHIINIRLSDEQYKNLRQLMKENDYMSESKFIRFRLFGKTTEEDQKTEPSSMDKEFLDQFNDFNENYKKIGHRLNDIIITYNTVSKLTNSQNVPIIDTTLTQALFKRITSQMDEMIQIQKEIRNLFSL